MQSFAIELPPYWQDLCDSGKLVSDGWIFCNSFNTELATGAGEDGRGDPFEAGASAARQRLHARHRPGEGCRRWQRPAIRST